MKNKIRRTHFPDKILLVPSNIRDERLDTCKNCEFYSDKGYCRINDKFITSLILARSSHCPLGQWSSYYGR